MEGKTKGKIREGSYRKGSTSEECHRKGDMCKGCGIKDYVRDDTERVT